VRPGDYRVTYQIQDDVRLVLVVRIGIGRRSTSGSRSCSGEDSPQGRITEVRNIPKERRRPEEDTSSISLPQPVEPRPDRVFTREDPIGLAGGATMNELYMERMTSPEIREAIDGGVRSVIVACGAIEQHGPHLPLFMDAEHGTRLAAEVARRLGKTLVAPTIRVGCSEHHMSFAGSLSVSEATFEAVCRDYAVSLARHGFRFIFFLPTHGGNFAPLRAAVHRLNEAVSGAARVHAFTDLDGQIEVWRRAVEQESGLGDRVGGHADIAETSIMLALHPDLVREERATAGYRGGLTPDILRRVFGEGIGAVTPNGILGDARGASAAMGRRCIEDTAALVAADFERIRAAAWDGAGAVGPDGSTVAR
jgi:creatinine amidohydrolase